MTTISILEAVNTTSVQFHGQPIITAMVSGVAYVAMRPIVENLGMSWSTQQTKLMKQLEKFNCVHMNMVAADGKYRDLLCLPLRKLNGWLFSINPAKVRADIRDKLIAYQEECFTVLHDYWTKVEAKKKNRQSTASQLTPLRQTAERLITTGLGKIYPDIWKLVHLRFDIEHIHQLEPGQIEEAIDYLNTLEGEYLGKEASPSITSRQFSDAELYEIVCLWTVSKLIKDDAVTVKKALELIDSPIASRISSCAHEIDYFMNKARDLLERETRHIASMPNPGLGWMTELKRLREG
ncbi:phage antirepressor N-terminal domain-containing protein [Serratia marcescens]|uniref:phage antirepressor N-terminal domain-containing protein n=1 Tax=Serratia marcescens TaxID=615 RepID=UPI00315A3C7F